MVGGHAQAGSADSSVRSLCRPTLSGWAAEWGGLGFEGDLDSMLTDLGQVRKLLEPMFAYPFERYHCPS